MLPDEEFRSRLRQDLGTLSPPPLGSLTSDSLTHGRKLRTRQRNLRVLGGTAAVAAIAVCSVTVSGAFGRNAATSASSGSNQTGTVVTAPATSGTKADDKLSLPASWTVQPEAKIVGGSYVTPQAIIKEVQKLLPTGSTSKLAGDYAWVGGDPRDIWAVTGTMDVTVGQATANLMVMVAGADLKKYPQTPLTCDPPPQPSPSPNVPPIPPQTSKPFVVPCGVKKFDDGTRVEVLHNFLGEGGVTVQIQRTDGLGIQVTARKGSGLTDDQLFAIASDPQLNVKMDKTLVANAESLKGDFMPVPPTS